MPRAVVRAFAKINLSLEVLNKRPDGFHNLRTIFQTISLHDVIDVDVRPAAESHIELQSDVEIPGENLIIRAARAVLELTGAAANIRFVLQKRIPMGGGLGGGSTDAAAVLLALPRLLGQAVDIGVLVEAGARLGSDIPFFLMGGTAVGLGRGTELYPLPDAEVRAPFGLLVTPSLHVSTPEAYRWLGRTEEMPVSATGFSATERLGLAIAAGDDWSRICANDFEPAVFAQHPRLAELRSQLEASGARVARMSGSGASLFGFFESEDARSRAMSAMAETATHAFTLLDRSTYRTETVVAS